MGVQQVGRIYGILMIASIDVGKTTIYIDQSVLQRLIERLVYIAFTICITTSQTMTVNNSGVSLTAGHKSEASHIAR